MHSASFTQIRTLLRISEVYVTAAYNPSSGVNLVKADLLSNSLSWGNTKVLHTLPCYIIGGQDMIERDETFFPFDPEIKAIEGFRKVLNRKILYAFHCIIRLRDKCEFPLSFLKFAGVTEWRNILLFCSDSRLWQNI
ncbi:hypothetical protein SUGI_0977910 [Cryptomeria japonica]|nr:hypothetical protein SUGI_0977910 [Cryptomeria japonica]